MKILKFSKKIVFNAVIEVNNKIIELNNNDINLLLLCEDNMMWLSEIAREIGITLKNVSTRIDKLLDLKLIEIYQIKNKKYIKSKVKLNKVIVSITKK